MSRVAPSEIWLWHLVVINLEGLLHPPDLCLPSVLKTENRSISFIRMTWEINNWTHQVIKMMSGSLTRKWRMESLGKIKTEVLIGLSETLYSLPPVSLASKTLHLYLVSPFIATLSFLKLLKIHFSLLWRHSKVILYLYYSYWSATTDHILFNMFLPMNTSTFPPCPVKINLLQSQALAAASQIFQQLMYLIILIYRAYHCPEGLKIKKENP